MRTVDAKRLKRSQNFDPHAQRRGGFHPLSFPLPLSALQWEATDTARQILTLREKHRNLITENLGYAAGNGHRVLEHLYERPIISVNEICELTGTSYPAANQLVERLVNIEILNEITGNTRNRRFRYDNYV